MYYIDPKVDFYITNVCNMTCKQCNRFNNFDFKGWQNWNDYEEQYTRWSKLVELRAITILGGEPFLNPSLKDWIVGLNRLFGIEIQVLTNGTRFSHSKNLYPSFLYRSPKTQALNHIGVSLHNINDWEVMREDIYNFLEAPVKEYKKGDAENMWHSDWHFIDKNEVVINVYISNSFDKASIEFNEYSRFVLHNSPVELAHQNCSFAQWKSYHFIKGKLYKCGPAALMPEFDAQHPFDISDEDRILLNSYRALSADNFEEYHDEFFKTLDNPIAQCKFCPSAVCDSVTIYPVRKGKNFK